MRISTGHKFETMTSQLQRTQSELEALRRQVISGRRFESARQDPTAARTVLSATAMQNRLDSLGKNIQSARGQIGPAEQALAEVSRMLDQAHGFGLQANNATAGSEERQTLANQVQSLMDRLVQIGNTKDAQGGSVFAGSRTQADAFALDAGDLVYQGDGLPRRVEIEPGRMIDANLAGADAHFTKLHSSLGELKDAILTGRTDEALAKVESGRRENLAARGELGVRLQTLTETQQRHQNRIDDLSEQIGDARDIDLAEAMTRYEQANTAYTAALQMTGRLSDLSLMDFLR